MEESKSAFGGSAGLSSGFNSPFASPVVTRGNSKVFPVQPLPQQQQQQQPAALPRPNLNEHRPISKSVKTADLPTSAKLPSAAATTQQQQQQQQAQLNNSLKTLQVQNQFAFSSSLPGSPPSTAGSPSRPPLPGIRAATSEERMSTPVFNSYNNNNNNATNQNILPPVPSSLGSSQSSRGGGGSVGGALRPNLNLHRPMIRSNSSINKKDSASNQIVAANNIAKLNAIKGSFMAQDIQNLLNGSDNAVSPYLTASGNSGMRAPYFKQLPTGDLALNVEPSEEDGHFNGVLEDVLDDDEVATLPVQDRTEKTNSAAQELQAFHSVRRRDDEQQTAVEELVVDSNKEKVK